MALESKGKLIIYIVLKINRLWFWFFYFQELIFFWLQVYLTLKNGAPIQKTIIFESMLFLMKSAFPFKFLEVSWLQRTLQCLPSIAWWWMLLLKAAGRRIWFEWNECSKQVFTSTRVVNRAVITNVKNKFKSHCVTSILVKSHWCKQKPGSKLNPQYPNK